MGTTLAHGIYLPSEGERNCYAGLKVNWETLDQKVADISALQSAIAGALHREIVASLPTTDIDTATIYMILNGTSATENIYDEYMYISNAWELIGTSATDLTNYYTKAEVDGKLLLKASASDLTSHTGDTTIHVTASDKAKWNTVALIKQLRLVNTQVGSATTIAFANIDDTNSIKVGDKCMDLDAKLFEITAVDTTNQTVSVGSALVDIALDANVVHTSGDETVAGNKTFSGNTKFNSSATIEKSGGDVELLIKNTGIDATSVSANAMDDIRFVDANNKITGVVRISYDTQNGATLMLQARSYSADGSTSSINGLSVTSNQQTGSIGRASISADLLPNSDGIYNCGSSTNIWKNLYGYHGYFIGQNQNDEYSSNARTNLTLLSNRDTLGVSGVLFDTYRQNTAQGTGIHIIGLGIKENSVRYEGCRWGWYWDNNLNGYILDFKPTTQGAYQAVKHNLGTSVDKWDTINGLEPSALGMPDLAKAVDISGELINAGTTTPSEYTPTVNGWIVIKIGATTGVVSMRAYSDGGIDNYAYSERSDICDTTGDTYARFASMTVPCVANDKLNIIIMPSTVSLISAKFYPCLGNV